MDGLASLEWTLQLKSFVYEKKANSSRQPARGEEGESWGKAEKKILWIQEKKFQMVLFVTIIENGVKSEDDLHILVKSFL